VKSRHVDLTDQENSHSLPSDSRQTDRGWGPGGGNGPPGTRTVLSCYSFRRVYHGAVSRADADRADLSSHGPHDLRHTFSIWLEDSGIPARVSMS